MERVEVSAPVGAPVEAQAGPSQEGRPGTYYPAARCKLCLRLFPMKPRAEGRGRKQAWEFCKLTHYSIWWTLNHPRKFDPVAGEKAIAEWREYQKAHASEIEAARALRVEKTKRAKKARLAREARAAWARDWRRTSPAARQRRNEQKRRRRAQIKAQRLALGLPTHGFENIDRSPVPYEPPEFVPTRAQLDALKRRRKRELPKATEPKYQPPEPTPAPFAPIPEEPPEQEASNPPPITPVDTQHKEGRLVEPEIRQQTAPISSCRLCQAAGKPCRAHRPR